MWTALAVPDDPQCPSWCPSVPSHLLSCPSTSTYLSCHRRMRFLILGEIRTPNFLSTPMTTVRFFSGLIFHDLCELVWCSGLNVLPGAVRNIAVNSPGYVYPYVLSCKQVAAISKLPHTCFIKRIHPWSSPVVLPRFSRATAGLIAVHMVYVHSGFCCSVILLTSAAACWCVHCACER